MTPQPIVLEKLRERPEFHHRGFLPRFAWACPASLVGYRPHNGAARPDPAARAAYAQAIIRILALPRCAPDEAPRLRIEGPALALWIAYHDRLEVEMQEDGRLSAVREWASKHPGRVARIAGGLHLVEHRGLGDCRVSPETMIAAIQIGEYLEAHALAAYDQMRADPRIEGARTVLAWVRRKGLTTFTARAALTALRAFKTMADLDPVLGLLVEYGHVRLPAPEAHRRRQASRLYEVNPASLGAGNFADSADTFPGFQPAHGAEGRDTEPAADEEIVEWRQ